MGVTPRDAIVGFEIIKFGFSFEFSKISNLKKFELGNLGLCGVAEALNDHFSMGSGVIDMIVSYLPNADLRNLKVTFRIARVDLGQPNMYSGLDPISITLPGACTFGHLVQLLISLGYMTVHNEFNLTIRKPVLDEDGNLIIFDEVESDIKITQLIGRVHLDENGCQHVDFAIKF